MPAWLYNLTGGRGYGGNIWEDFSGSQYGGHPFLWQYALGSMLPGLEQQGIWDWQRKLFMDYMTNSMYGLKWLPNMRQAEKTGGGPGH